MKRINKTEPDFYKEALRKEHPVSWKDVTIKTEIREYMLCEEQNYQCAYTETRLQPDNFHIDHFVKQEFINRGLFRNLTIFSWENLFISCNNENFGAKFKDKTTDTPDYKLLLNPAKESPEAHFSYSWMGDILFEKQDEKARKTCEVFNLNDNSLIEQRKVVAQQVLNMYQQFTLDELSYIIGRFESMIVYLYKQLKT